MSEIKVATDANFQELVLGSDKPVVVDFWAVVVRALQDGRAGDGEACRQVRRRIQVVKVDVDANPVLSQAFNIMSIPTIAFFRPGKDENGNAYTPQGVVGFRPLEQLEAQFGLKQFTAGGQACRCSRPTRPLSTSLVEHKTPANSAGVFPYRWPDALLLR